MEKRILIVEDEAVSAMLLEVEINTMGYSVLEIVSGGREAVQSALEKNPDLILMDIYLDDDLDGIEAVKQIHQSQKIPIIYLTASTEPETLKRAKETEYKYLLHKPYVFQKIKEAIDQVIG